MFEEDNVRRFQIKCFRFKMCLKSFTAHSDAQSSLLGGVNTGVVICLKRCSLCTVLYEFHFLVG
jgi:hypothetical protein